MSGASILNIVVDPFGIIGSPRAEVLNTRKPYAGDRGRIAKIYQVERVRPGALILGNSRPELALDPQHRCLKERPQPTYNLSLPGLSFVRQVQYGLHGVAVAPVRQVLLGVDFLDFLYVADSEITERPLADWPRSLQSLDGQSSFVYQLSRLENYGSVVFSFEALKASLGTIFSQGRSHLADRTDLGFHPAEGLYVPIIEREGLKTLFDQKHEELATRLQGKNWRVIDPGKRTSEDLIALDAFLELAEKRSVEVILFVNPYHIEYLLHIELAGLWQQFEEWKKAVAAISLRHGVAIWDFSGINRYTTEKRQVYSVDYSAMRWFWEPAHYRRELGDMMLDFMLMCEGAKRDDDLGVQLEAVDLPDYLRTQRRALDRFMRGYPRTVKYVDSFYLQAGGG